jgi:NAD(P)-dependent dehydrogenase (short-subunit alcohol dehydrogenase family)
MNADRTDHHEHAIVVGGASGIGLQVVRRLLARKVAVTVLDVAVDGSALSDLTTDEAADSLAVLQADVTDRSAVAAAFSAARERFGAVNRLVVSVGGHGQLLDTVNLDVDEWQQLMDVHVRGTLLLAQEFGTRLPPESGDGTQCGEASMVSVGSTTGLTASRKQGDYGPAKAALAHLTRVLAMEWAGSGVRANVVAPGMTRTPFVENMVTHGYDLSEAEQRTPLGRLAEVDEVATVIEFLLLDATYVTGVVLPVDGGWTALGR